MRKYFAPLALLPLVINTFAVGNGCLDCCECKATSKTFFSVRPQYQSATPEKDTFFWDRMNLRDLGHGGAVQCTLFGGKSTDRCLLATYFTPYCKRCLTVKEIDDGSADLIAQHFNILTQAGQETLSTNSCNQGPFCSVISFCPKVSVFGLGLTYRQNLSNLWNNDDDEERSYDIWFEISTPITRVETSLGFCENVINDGGGAYESENTDYKFYASMTEALTQRAWRYGKICMGEMTRWRLADIEVKLGIQTEREDHLFGAYVGAIIPAGNRPCGEYLFEPMVGHNKHAGITSGGYVHVRLWENESETRKFGFSVYAHRQYLFSACECRSFDLKCRPWSRYMQVYISKEQAIEASHITDPTLTSMFATPGINVFTQCLCVSPRYSLSLINGWVYTGKKWDLEFGYNFYSRQAECVELCNWCNKEIVLKDCIGKGIANKYRTISHNNQRFVFPPVESYNAINYDDAIITRADLDLESAAHPGLLSHTFFWTTGYKWDDKEYPMMVTFGVSYEFGKENYVLDRWTVWGKYTFSF